MFVAVKTCICVTLYLYLYLYLYPYRYLSTSLSLSPYISISLGPTSIYLSISISIYPSIYRCIIYIFGAVKTRASAATHPARGVGLTQHAQAWYRGTVLCWFVPAILPQDRVGNGSLFAPCRARRARNAPVSARWLTQTSACVS